MTRTVICSDARVPPLTPHTAVRCTLGLVLLLAGALKAQDSLVARDGSRSALAIAQIAFEVTLGVLLIAGKSERQITFIALASFGVFACVALYKAALGLPSCGCFGKLHMPPMYTAMFDVLAVLALAAIPPAGASVKARRMGWSIACVALVAFAGIGAAAPSIRAQSRASSEDEDVTSAGAIVVLEPEKWLDKPLPLLKHIDPPEANRQLTTGHWTLLLYHHDCSTCRTAIPKYEQLARGESQRIALIEMPPYAPAGEGPVSAESPCLLGKLSDKHEWFATTPVVLTLVDGRVTSVVQGEQALARGQ